MRFRIALLVTATLMLTSSSLAEEVKQPTLDQLKIAVQKICPVSGKPLGSMGAPLKVRIGEEEIFLCCKGCAKGQINKQHWAKIHANFAKAQGKCPVMDKELPANPKWTFVKGQIVYICCPPCTKKIQADPAKYITKLSGYYQTSLKLGTKSRPAKDAGAIAALPKNRDQLKAAVQGICPVSGNKLGSMGETIKVKAGGMDLFLCCKSCKEGKIKKEHWATIQNNIATAQGNCPVMEKRLPSNAKSAVIGGQLIFVCCPPCTKKIEKEPAKFLGKIDAYYLASLKQRAAASTSRR